MVETGEVLRAWRRWRFALVAFLAGLTALASFAAAQTQDAADLGEPLSQLREADGSLSPEAVRDLVARLDDAEVRALLLERLDGRR